MYIYIYILYCILHVLKLVARWVSSNVSSSSVPRQKEQHIAQKSGPPFWAQSSSEQSRCNDNFCTLI